MPEEAAAIAESPALAPVIDVDKLSHQDYRTLRETGKVPEQLQQDTKTSAASSEAESEPDSETGESTPDQEQPKRKGGFQKRIDRLTKQNAELQAQLAAKQTAGTPEAKADAKPAAAAPEARAEGKPVARDFNTYEDFVEALSDWKAEQREAARTRAAAEAKAVEEAKAAGERWKKQLDEARTRYDDFDDVALTDAPISEAVHNAIVGSEDHGADLAYYLGQNPAVREQINAMKPIAATLALGKILASLDAGNAGETPEGDKSKVSAAPAPIKPLGSKSVITAKRIDDMTQAEYRKARESGRIR